MIKVHEEVPFSLKQVKGQKTALTYLENYSKNPYKIPPLLVFYGPPGVGKYFAAERFVKTILCSETSSCGRCVSCRIFAIRSHQDFIEFPIGTNIPIGEVLNPKEYSIRWLINQRIIFSPTHSKKRFVLIPDATQINSEAETALLKTLEEAPDHTRFIFLVEDYRDLKQTITSRAVLVPFNFLPKNIMSELSHDKDIFLHEFQGGTFELNFIEPETWEEYTYRVRSSIYDSILLTQLESWILSHKFKESSWKIEFDYKKFLNIITSIMLFSYSVERKSHWEESSEAIYEFKEYLQRDVPGMDSFILSKLFSKLVIFNT